MRHLSAVLVTIGVLLGPTVSASAAGPVGGGGSVCRGFGEGATIVMRDSCFEGTGHVVPSGRTVTVVNEGQLPHTITAVDGSFDSGVVEPGQLYELTLDDSGPVPVYCTLHGTLDGGGMAGLLLTSAPTAGADTQLAASTAARTRAGAWVVALLVATVGGVAFGRRTVRTRAGTG